MRNIVLIVLAVALAAVGVTGATHAQEPAPLTPLSYIDTQVDLFAQCLAQQQAQALLERGQYLQFLSPYSAVPVGIAAPDNLTAAATDGEQAAYLWTACALPDVLGWEYRIDVYDAPDGLGYVLHVRTTVDGVTYAASYNTGPEDYRNMPWYVAGAQ